MADKIFHSTAVTFVDMTDSRILDVYISSNHPTVQICNVNKTPFEYTPDWSVNNLELKASFYLDSSEITPETIEWYTKIGTVETTVGNNDALYVTNNVLENNAIITYGCRVTYQNLEAFKEITFTRVDTGLNGTNGMPAPAVQAQYSADGSAGWTATLNTATHKYIRYSYDGGKTWTIAIKMVGEDGTSVNIKGTATSKTAVSSTSYYTLVYNSVTITGAAIGDAYLLDGNLYVCVDSRDGNDYFMDVGRIQGPQGNDGQSSYVFIRYATDASGSNMSASPSSTTTHIGICTVNTNVAPTTANSYTWSKFVGENAKSIILNGSSQIFKVTQGATATYSPTTITVTAQAINTTVAKWEYSVNGGISWTTTAPSGIALNSSTNTITITGANLTSNSIVVKASNGSYSDTYTVYKVSDGTDGTPGNPGTPASIAFLTNENISFSANASGQVALTSFTTNVVAYNGATKVTPTLGTITGLPSGMTVASPVTTANEQILTFSIANNSTLGAASSNNGTITIPVTSPVSTNLILSWSKINTGATGVGIASTTVSYGESDSSSVQPTSWQPSIPDVAEGKYLWTRTIIDYTDANKADTVTYTYAKQGMKGDEGKGGTSVTVSSIQYQEGSSATTAPTGTWSNAVVAAAEGKYLWTKTVFSDGKTAYGVAKQGAKGNTGRGVSKITEYYLATTASSDVTISTSGWTETVQTIDITKKYLWNYELITYTDNTTSSTTPVIIGVFGNTGATGKGISSVAERYLATTSSSGVTTSTSGWTPEIQAPTSTKKYLWNYEIITYTDGTTSTISPVIIGVYGDKGDKGDTGNTGRGVSSIVEQYYQSTSATSQTEGSWSTTVPAWVDGKYIWTRSVITYTDSTTSTTSPVCVTGQKGGTGGTGVGVSSVDVWYYQSTSATSLSGGSWSTTSPTWSDGKYVWTKTIITYTNNTTDETTAVCITGQKGSTGVGIKSVTEYYLATSSSSGVTISTTGWTTTIQTITVDKKYLWNYEIITYTDNTTTTTTPIIIGVFGSTGKGIKSVTEYYLATASSSGVTTSTSGWNTTMQSLTATSKYLWNYELITYTDNTTSTINPVIIGVYGDKGNQGDPGVGINSVTVTYGTSTSTSTQPTSWQTTIPTVADGSYLWTKTITDYTDDSMADTVTYTYAKQGKTPVKGTDYVDGNSVTVSSIQYQSSTSATTAPTGTWSNSVVTVAEGSYLWTKTTFSDGKVAYGVAKQGKSGLDAYTVMLSNEAYFFEADSRGVPAEANVTLDVIGYQGATRIATTVGTITGLPSAGMTATISNNGATNTQIQIAVTESLTSVDSGVLTIPVTVGGKVVNKQFSWTKSKEGLTGAQGSDAITFQIYSENGYVLSKDVPSITLQTFAYNGDVPIEAGATYQWYKYTSGNWEAMTDATNSSLKVSHSEVSFSGSYMCKMLFNNIEYVGVATIDDKNDTNMVFTSKPSSYAAGDIWIVGGDYAPSGVITGTVLKADYPSNTYRDQDWVTATKYDKALEDINKHITTYNQYFDFDDDDGLKITARDKNGVESKFSTTLTNEQLAFNYGDEAIAYINGTSMHIKEVEVESPLTITGTYVDGTIKQLPTFNIGNFSIVVESNGSLSIVSNI